jgi:hypothetical protein
MALPTRLRVIGVILSVFLGATHASAARLQFVEEERDAKNGVDGLGQAFCSVVTPDGKHVYVIVCIVDRETLTCVLPSSFAQRVALRRAPSGSRQVGQDAGRCECRHTLVQGERLLAQVCDVGTIEAEVIDRCQEGARQSGRRASLDLESPTS